jgi:hypothetical protein
VTTQVGRLGGKVDVGEVVIDEDDVVDAEVVLLVLVIIVEGLVVVVDVESAELEAVVDELEELVVVDVVLGGSEVVVKDVVVVGGIVVVLELELLVELEACGVKVILQIRKHFSTEIITTTIAMSPHQVWYQRLSYYSVAGWVQSIVSSLWRSEYTHSKTVPMGGISSGATAGYTCETTVGSDEIMTGGAVTMALFATALNPCVAMKEPFWQ